MLHGANWLVYILQIVDCMILYFGIESAAIATECDYEGELKRTLWNLDQLPRYYINESHLDQINSINCI